jgi:hypothetical protein
MPKKLGILERLADIEARDDIFLAMMRDQTARQQATEHVVELIAAAMLTAMSPDQRRDILNDLFAARAEASEKLSADALGGGEAAYAAELEVQTKIHLARLLRQMAAFTAASSVGVVKS